MAAARHPALIALDWGTSSLRGYLLAADGGVLETATRPWGIRHLPPGGFATAFEGLVGDWRSRAPRLAILAAGMVGSRQGWREVPYVDCPADAEAIARGLVTIEAGPDRIQIVPGLLLRGPLPDVLRGEETQIVGSFARDPSLAKDSLLVLPGTHSKWVEVRDGRIGKFRTFMTGELFAVLRDHSLLGGPAREAAPHGPDPDERTAGFDRGLAVAREGGTEGITGRLFTCRSLFLTGDLAPAATLDYLSGLLVGEEIRSVLASRGDRPLPRAIAVVGDESLCGRYRRGLDAFGITQTRVLGDTAAAGLWQIAALAGLMPDGQALLQPSERRAPARDTHG